MDQRSAAGITSPTCFLLNCYIHDLKFLVLIELPFNLLTMKKLFFLNVFLFVTVTVSAQQNFDTVKIRPL